MRAAFLIARPDIKQYVSSKPYWTLMRASLLKRTQIYSYKTISLTYNSSEPLINWHLIPDDVFDYYYRYRFTILTDDRA